MKIKQIGIVCLLFMSTQIMAQSSIEDFVREGIQYHDKGEFEKAIEIYEKALKIDPKSTLVNYEIALSNFSKGDYQKAIKFSDIVLAQKEGYMLQAYLTKGSALDVLGKTRQSINLFKEAIQSTEGHHLLYYNLALNYYKLQELDNAEENVINAIKSNTRHSSSHLMLANIHNKRGNSVQTILATHYFLFLEPNTERSMGAYQVLQDKFSENVSEDENKSNTINLMFSGNADSQFGAAELMIPMFGASRLSEENKGKTDEEMFIENTASFFTILGELKEKEQDNKDIWWAFYTPFFYDLAKSEHVETYFNYITQYKNPTSINWLNENKNKLTDFDNWLKKK